MPPSFASACRGMTGLGLPAPSTLGSLGLSRTLKPAPAWCTDAYRPLTSRLGLFPSQTCLHAPSGSRPVWTSHRTFGDGGQGSLVSQLRRFPHLRPMGFNPASSLCSPSTSPGGLRSHRSDATRGGFSIPRQATGARQLLSQEGLRAKVGLFRRAFEDLRTLLSSRYRARSSSPPISPMRRKIIAARRRIPRMPDNPMIIVYVLLAINAIVILAWQYALYSYRDYKDPGPYIFMARNFLSGEFNLREGRFWTLLTACVSHEDFTHFGLNMVSLVLTAPPVLNLVGPGVFLMLYFGAGVASSAISMGWHRFVDPWVGRGVNSAQSKQAGTRPTSAGFSHGASGSVYAIMSTFACLMPNATFLIFFVIPAPAWACMTGVLGWDLYSAWFTPGGRTDSAGHVGGVLAGVAFWRFGLRGMRMN